MAKGKIYKEMWITKRSGGRNIDRFWMNYCFPCCRTWRRRWFVVM